LPVDGGQDGFAGAAGWFAVVIEAVGLADAVGPAMVTAAVVAQAVDERHGGFGRARWRRLREEAALLDLDRVRAGRSQCGEWIGHVAERRSVMQWPRWQAILMAAVLVGRGVRDTCEVADGVEGEMPT